MLAATAPVRARSARLLSGRDPMALRFARARVTTALQVSGGKRPVLFDKLRSVSHLTQAPTRPSMANLRGPCLAALLAIHPALPAFAADRAPTDATEPNAGQANPPAVLTGKERLGKKWMDEQRIDNCRVPIENRGTRPRPSTCPQVPSG
jgi:hypothetical protein